VSLDHPLDRCETREPARLEPLQKLRLQEPAELGLGALLDRIDKPGARPVAGHLELANLLHHAVHEAGMLGVEVVATRLGSRFGKAHGSAVGEHLVGVALLNEGPIAAHRDGVGNGKE